MTRLKAEPESLKRVRLMLLEPFGEIGAAMTSMLRSEGLTQTEHVHTLDAARAKIRTHVWDALLLEADGTPASVSVAMPDGPDLVARVADYAARAPEAYGRYLAQLHALADRVIDSLADSRDFIALAADYFAALCRLDAAANAGIVTAQHFHLAELAAPHGGTFKSSGAGGGDVGLVFTHRGDDEKRLHAALERAGARFVDLAFGAPGLRCETRQSPG